VEDPKCVERPIGTTLRALLDEMGGVRGGKKLLTVIPGGASTGSKQAPVMYGPESRSGPTHFVRAHGCRVVTPSGVELVDCTMALGAVALGYADELVAEAVAAAATGATEVLGPAPLFRLRGRERFQVVLKTRERAAAIAATGAAVETAARERALRAVAFSVDVDPQ
jgi:glutamate-1-semialdehyde aminotransferase